MAICIVIHPTRRNGIKMFEIFFSFRCVAHYFFITNATPVTASSIPAIPMSVNVSENNNQASIAVSGGVRYIKLETWVAALLRIRAYNKNMAPIDNAKIDHK